MKTSTNFYNAEDATLHTRTITYLAHKIEELSDGSVRTVVEGTKNRGCATEVFCRGNRGVADLVGLYNGRKLFVEVGSLGVDKIDSIYRKSMMLWTPKLSTPNGNLGVKRCHLFVGGFDRVYSGPLSQMVSIFIQLA